MEALLRCIAAVLLSSITLSQCDRSATHCQNHAVDVANNIEASTDRTSAADWPRRSGRRL